MKHMMWGRCMKRSQHINCNGGGHMLLKKTGLLAIMALVCWSLPAHAAEQPFDQWLQGVKQEARQRGITQNIIERAFKDVEPQGKIIRLDRKQPEGTLTFPEYKKRVISQHRIRRGRELYQKHKALLDKVGRKFGVQPRFIVALWGIETAYGEITGGYNVIEALATLAYDGRRSEFFRKELMNALDILNEGHIAPENMLGSWAGAMGQSQFMPSSFKSLAYDFDQDGRRDIWTDLEDVFASIANYLSKSGWNDEVTWGRAVRLPKDFPSSLEGREIRKPIPAWQALGVRKINGNDLPGVAIDASIVIPEGSPHGYMVYHNYHVLMKWNRSIYFATAVGLLSDEIAGR